MKAGSLAPVGLVALLTFWAGTFAGAATALGAATHHALLLAFCLAGAARWKDPLRLGARWAWLPAAALAGAIASVGLSPLPRAGRVGLLLLPAYLLLPAAAARCWPTAERRRQGAIALSVSLLAVSGAALLLFVQLGSPRAALPLGHHNLLAHWIVLVLPLATLPAIAGGPGKRLGRAAGVAGVVVLGATGSLLGATAIAAQLLALAIALPRLRRWAPLALLPLAPFVPRLLRLTLSFDPSALARSTYLRAGLSGTLERPWSGWGAGATPWTVAEWMRPLAGRNPPSEIVGDLHSLPAQLAYELGLPTTVAAFAALAFFVVRRLDESRVRREPEVTAALLGLLGFGVMSFGAAPLSVPALPATLAVVAGMALAPAMGPSAAPRALAARVGVVLLYVLPATLFLLPIDRAHIHYDRALRAQTNAEALAELERAEALDPHFPLYRARRTWLAARTRRPTLEVAADALAAARAARGLAPLWLGAGEVAQSAGHPDAAAALRTALRLDPLSPLAAFRAMAADPSASDAVALGARAVRADHRLARATWWALHPRLAQRVEASSGVEIRSEVAPGDERFRLGLTFDRVPALSFSLYAFRRSPWLWTLAPVEIAEPAVRGEAQDPQVD